MLIYIVRHGKARKLDSGSDRDRPLTERGERQAAYLAHRLKDLQPPPRVYASSYRRARDTAAIIAEAIGVETALDTRLEFGPASLVLDLLFECAGQGPIPVVLVGHQPQLASLIDILTRGVPGSGADIPLRTGEACVLSIPEGTSPGPGSASLEERLRLDD